MLRKLVDIANLVIAVLTGFYLILLVVTQTDGVKAVPHNLVDSTGLGILAFLVGAGVVGFNIYLLVVDWKESGLRRNLVITTDQGKSELHVKAVEFHILSDLKEEPDVFEPMVFVAVRGEGKPMLCEVALKLRKRDDVIARVDGLKRRIRDAIDRLVPGGITVEVVVEVLELVTGGAGAGRERPPEALAFNGPVYADPGDDPKSV